MEFHLERGMRLNSAPKHKNLYSWAINEIDKHGQQFGEDQIPWAWTLHFAATSCVLNDNISIASKFQDQQTTALEIAKRQIIRAALRPHSLRNEGDDLHSTTFSMFGTNRIIKSFQLNIQPISDPIEQERCTAWGSVSYTADVDFRDETTDDCIVFYLFVNAETFAHYAAKISHSLVDEIIFSVGSVAGFYAEWSPSISTRQVKVLTQGSEQKVSAPPGLDFEPPRLGEVGAAELHLNRRIEFGKVMQDREEDEINIKTAGERFGTGGPTTVASQSLQMLKSVRRTAYFAVVLLVLICIATILKG